ncbi:MAG: hypothetical protein Ct9H300mP18_07730 [Candidatus Neomarinimicrobiota bacterium]|nr:MAG: hypothetical protein Ct9H300mP18_07730 [Candidatus Neomarinimicrobiota bacterium]
MAWDEDPILTNDDIIAAMKKNDEVKSEAIIVAGRRKLEQVLPDIEAFLESGDQEIRAASAIAIVELGSGATKQAESILIEMLNSDNELTQSKALERLVDNDNILTQEKLIEFLSNKGTIISNVALKIAEKRNDEELIPAIISNLDVPKTSLQARETLSKYSDEIILNQFESLLSSEKTMRKLRLGIVRALRDFPNDESINHLISQLSSTDQDIYNESVDSLLAIARIEPLSEGNINKISEEINSIANKLYALYETIKILPENEDSILIHDYLNNEIQNILPTLLKLGVMGIPDTPIETYIQTVKNRDAAKLPFLLEFFENIFTKDQRKVINPLIEPISIDERSKIGHNNFNKLPKNLNDELIASTYDPDKWKSVISLDYLLKSEKTDVIKSLDWQKVEPSNANQELLARQLQKNGMNLDFIPKERFKLEGLELAMYSTLEKTIILKSVDMFKSIPAENLSRVAQITEEVEFEANTQIMAEGDYGDSLFIVVDGNVKIHKGDQEIVRLGKGTCLGEMALLDGEPRSADATVTEDSTLFKIEQEGFYEVMGSQSEIMEGIIKLLSGKLRDTNEKLMSK